MRVECIRLENILSFEDERLKFRPLNVLIGPNGSGKSNLIACLSLLRAAPQSLNDAVLRGGGASAWIRKSKAKPSQVARIGCEVAIEDQPTLSYSLSFSAPRHTLQLEEEMLRSSGQIYFQRRGGKLNIEGSVAEMPLPESVLSQMKDPTRRSPVDRVGEMFGRMRAFRGFNTAPLSQARNGVASAVGGDFLVEDGSNLAAVLHEMSFHGVIQSIQDSLAMFGERFRAIKTRLEGPVVQTYDEEAGLAEPISAVRLSDGALKFLCLMAALYSPNPPSMVCIEEPELGLHPDAVRLVGEILLEASSRMQIVVATHSETLVDALSEEPESVVVCDYDADSGTHFRRLSKDELDGWLDRYSLGQLWQKGQLGGNRW